MRLNEILGRHYSFMQPKSIAAAVVSPIWQICILDIIRYFQISEIRYYQIISTNNPGYSKTQRHSGGGLEFKNFIESKLKGGTEI